MEILAEVGHAIYVLGSVVLAIVLALLFCFFGAFLALGAALAAVPALIVAGVIALFFDVSYIDALAWTWSTLTVVAMALVGGFGARR